MHHKIVAWFKWSRLALLSGVVLLSACGPTRVVMKTTDTINPDINGRPSPLVLRLYELKSPTAFNGSDFFSIFQKDKETLGPELLIRDEFFLKPGDKQKIKRALQNETRFVGVVGAFRDLEHAQWRSIVAVTPDKTATLVVRLDAKRVTIATR